MVLGEVLTEHRLPLLNEVTNSLVFVSQFGSCDLVGVEISDETEICSGDHKLIDYDELYGFFTCRSIYRVLRCGWSMLLSTLA